METKSGGMDAKAAAQGPQAKYFAFLRERKWHIQRCDSCARAIFYPRVVCPHCGGTSLQWFEPTGLGSVYSSTCVMRKADAGGNYNLALIDLDEGVRMMSRVDGLPPDRVQIGMRVRARLDGPAESPRVVFNPVEDL